LPLQLLVEYLALTQREHKPPIRLFCGAIPLAHLKSKGDA